MKVVLTPSGTVGILPASHEEVDRLSDLAPYLFRVKGRILTWWTYLPDLARDLAGEVVTWAPSVKANLPSIQRGVAEMQEGDDAEVLSVFAEGTKPYDFQLRSIHSILNAERLLLADATGLGKQQPVDAPVLTPMGWRPIGELRPGDFVVGSSGGPTLVTGVFPQGIKPSYRVRFSDGTSAEAGPEHLWGVDYKRGGKYWARLVLTTDQLRLRPKVGRLDLSKTILYLPTLSGPARFVVDAGLPIPAYVLGAIIANGSTTRSTPQLVYGARDWPEVSRMMVGADVSPPRRYGSVVHVRVRGIVRTIASLGLDVLSRYKRIPRPYLEAAPEERCRLLQGLMDADGSISRSRNKICYHTTSPGLAEDVQELARGLGGIASIRSYDRSHHDKPIEYQVRIRCPSWIDPFTISRKADRYTRTPQTRPCRTVKSVEYVRDVESVCIAVDAPDRLYVAEDYALTHNTISALGAYLTARARGNVERAVFVVPSGLKVQWHEELHVFAKESPRSLVIQPGDAKTRRKAYARDWEVLIVNRELLLRDEEHVRRIVEMVDFAVLDEASSIRNPDTEISRCVKDLFSDTRYRVALTATPVENRLADLRSVFEWVDPKVFPSEEYFNSRYVLWRKRSFKVKARNGKTFKVRKVEPKGYKNLNEVRGKIRPRYLRRRVSEVGLELPNLVVSWESVRLGKVQRGVYERLRDALTADPSSAGPSGLLGGLQALRQACDSTELVQGREDKVASSKVLRVRELLEGELADEQVILFTCYERFARILARELKKFKPARYTGVGTMTRIERQRAVDAFRAGDKRVLIGTEALERGHNLQCAAVVVNVDLPFNPARLKQRLGRVRRIGSDHDCVRMINLVAEDTVEDKLIKGKLYAKRGIFEDVLGDDELTDADPLLRLRDVGGLL